MCGGLSDSVAWNQTNWKGCGMWSFDVELNEIDEMWSFEWHGCAERKKLTRNVKFRQT